MSAKTNLKAVETKETGEDTSYKYSSEQVSEMANHLYYVEAMLDVLSYAGETPSDINGTSISTVALDARNRISQALKILDV